MAIEKEYVGTVDVVADRATRYINRELSWLDYAFRILAVAEDRSLPVLERVKMLAIVSSGVDEFYQVRVAGLKDQAEAGLAESGPDGMSPTAQLRAIRETVGRLTARQSAAFSDDIVPALTAAGIVVSDWHQLDQDARDHLGVVFDERIFPVLTPLAVDPGHPFPYISNLSLNLAVLVRDPDHELPRFARVKVPPLLPRLVVLPDQERFVPIEQVIAAHLDLLFPGMEVVCHYFFRVLRNADLTLEEEEADDLLAAVEIELRRRRFGRAVRLEVEPSTSDEVLELLVRELELGDDDVYRVPGPLALSGLASIYDLDRPDLKLEPWSPVTQVRLASSDDEAPDMFAVLRKGDVLVQHPYDSFATSVETFFRQAAADPDVLAIKLTLYRTSGDSPIIKSLIRAAERGKQVAALVELKARFDEQANIAWARALEQAGVHVVYGLVGLKTHSKTALVVRQEEGGIRRYCHVGTGNYNPKTARAYEDIGLLTADVDIGADLTDLFNFLTGYSRRTDYRKLLVAPASLRDEMTALIRAEAAAPAGTGRIVMKLNNLVDAGIIDALYAASAAGARIDLIVRGVCSLRPQVPGLSENINVRSIVGRYLEHSRIFAFGDGDSRPVRYFIGSADMMPRNLNRRVEVVAPVERVELQDRLRQILDIALSDDTLSWVLGADGSWTRVATQSGINVHRQLQEAATQRSRRAGEGGGLRTVS